MTDQVNENTQAVEEDEVFDLFADNADEQLIGTEEEGATPASPGTSEAPAAKEAPEADETIPEKFRNKSAAEIAASYVELERTNSRTRNELAELRKTTDRILEAQLGKKEGDRPVAEITSDELLANPQAVIDQAVANHPEVKAARESTAKTDLQRRAASFQAAVPDAGEIMKSQAFASWLQANPHRSKRFTEADTNYDFDTAAEILLTYKEFTSVAPAADTTQRDADLKALGSPKTVGDTGGKKKPVFKSEDLMRLRQEDPERYERLQPTIQLAYLEKRVR